jgi:hypothetical protein
MEDGVFGAMGARRRVSALEIPVQSGVAGAGPPARPEHVAFPDDYPRRVGDAVYKAAPALRRESR